MAKASSGDDCFALVLMRMMMMMMLTVAVVVAKEAVAMVGHILFQWPMLMIAVVVMILILHSISHQHRQCNHGNHPRHRLTSIQPRLVTTTMSSSDCP